MPEIKSRKLTEIHLEESLIKPAFKSAQNTQKSLERVYQNLQKLQQQIQLMSQSRMMARSEGQGKKRYWSDKGIRPMKFEYEFKANPLFREQIQQQKSMERHSRFRSPGDSLEPENTPGPWHEASTFLLLHHDVKGFIPAQYEPGESR